MRQIILGENLLLNVLGTRVKDMPNMPLKELHKLKYLESEKLGVKVRFRTYSDLYKQPQLFKPLTEFIKSYRFGYSDFKLSRIPNEFNSATNSKLQKILIMISIRTKHVQHFPTLYSKSAVNSRAFNLYDKEKAHQTHKNYFSAHMCLT